MEFLLGHFAIVFAFPGVDHVTGSADRWQTGSRGLESGSCDTDDWLDPCIWSIIRKSMTSWNLRISEIKDHRGVCILTKGDGPNIPICLNIWWFSWWFFGNFPAIQHKSLHGLWILKYLGWTNTLIKKRNRSWQLIFLEVI